MKNSTLAMKLSMLVLQIKDFCAENGTEKSQFFVDREGKLRVFEVYRICLPLT